MPLLTNNMNLRRITQCFMILQLCMTLCYLAFIVEDQTSFIANIAPSLSFDQASAQTRLNIANKKPALSTLKPPIHNFTQTKTSDTNEESASDNTMKPYESLEWKDLDTTREAACGKMKCFFRYTLDDTAGYTVQWLRGPEMDWKINNNTWYYAQHLKQMYNISHLMLEPPFNKTIGHYDHHKLNTNLTVWNKPETRKEKLNKYKRDRIAIVQKHRVAPSSSILFKAKKGFNKDHYNMVRLWNTTDDRRLFTNTLESEWNLTSAMLEKEKSLKWDFQMFVDNDGKIYHFDLDRAFRSKTHKLGIAFQHFANKFTDLIMQMKYRLDHNATETKYWWRCKCYGYF